ncbi:MAG: polysaccharide biosynthesis protein [Vicinamibacterales bacterium]
MIDLDRDAQERLLGRVTESVLTSVDRRALRGQRLLVTGAGGSVGGELARQLAACGPTSLTLFDHAEYNLFRIERDLRESYPDLPLTAVLGDVSRRADIRAASLIARPTAIYHAAAYKHVPIAETSIVAAARVNVLGTAETARSAREVGARFVLVSSDKAAEPRSVMGATKRFAELLALRQRSRLFRPIAVRFGNILGSSGSVVEIMMRAVRTGRSVPITSPDASRFFMTGQEAASLVLKADLIGRGGEVFWLDMGQPLRIADLAERVIDYATPVGTPKVAMEIIGLRPGEKVREELTTQGLEMRRTSHARIWSARQRDTGRPLVDHAIRQLRRGCATGDAAGVLNAIKLAVEDFEPSQTARAAGRRVALAVAAAPSIAASSLSSVLAADR